MLLMFLYASSLAAEPPQISAGPTFQGRCDASSFVPVGADRILVADDEKKSLGLFAVSGGAPSKVRVKDHVGVDEELDLEGAAMIGDVAYFIGSHGRTSSGKPAPARAHLFALHPGDEPRFVGRSFSGLAEALYRLPEVGTRLKEAAQRPPKSLEGGLNIEGLAATAEGALLIGLRNPLIDGRAIVVTLSNPAGVLQGDSPSIRAELVDLGGRGVRAMLRHGDQTLIVAGAVNSERDFAIYRWDRQTLNELEVDLGDLNPEAIGVVGDRLLLLSDDGREDVDGISCKDAEAGKQSFRSAWLQL